jgi:hypothetical protein
MKQSEALTISIGVLGGVDVFLTATVIPVPVWVTFTAWASFFIVGGGVRGFTKSVSCNITGIIIAALSLLAIDVIGPNPLVAAICVGIGSAGMVQASKLPFTHGITPAIVWGFSQTVGTVAVTGIASHRRLAQQPGVDCDRRHDSRQPVRLSVGSLGQGHDHLGRGHRRANDRANRKRN